jgi:hypothetical protein
VLLDQKNSLESELVPFWNDLEQFNRDISITSGLLKITGAVLAWKANGILRIGVSTRLGI